jgi:hypothetical protein
MTLFREGRKRRVLKNLKFKNPSGRKNKDLENQLRFRTATARKDPKGKKRRVQIFGELDRAFFVASAISPFIGSICMTRLVLHGAILE